MRRSRFRLRSLASSSTPTALRSAVVPCPLFFAARFIDRVVSIIDVELGARHAGVNRRRRRLFDTTLTELNAIAALARIGLRRMPKNGYSAPAATGMPTTL